MGKYILDNHALLDTKEGVLKSGFQVLVDDNRVIEVAKGTINASDAEKIDLGGRTLMPGLIDCHAHVFISGFNDNQSVLPSEMTARSSTHLRGMVQRGFTTIRDAGGADYGHKMSVENGHFEGPRMFVSGRILSQTGGHGDHRGKADFCSCMNASMGVARIADGVDAVRHAVREEIRHGADQIKIMAGGGVSSPADELHHLQYSTDEIVAIVDEATRAGRYVMSHVYNTNGIQRAVECGVRTIEHGNFLDDKTAKVMAKNEAFLVPTLVTYRADAKYGPSFGWSKDSERKNQEVLEAGVKSLEIAMKAGVKVGYGTDLCWSPKSYQPEGLLVHSEVMSPIEAIQNATIINAEIVRMENQLGVITPGAFADLLAVDGDPTQDLGVLQNEGEHMPMIMANGVFAKNRLT
ncbi:MAG: peptidase M38 [Acidiferrobacteraceae bacterium]|jgi:imidazolonepropionase-like amidohydrolase|nr:peptidase M38 [Acidiferrobacteraceae bacterium]|tara:strand:+ start:126 stop:1346 length:1221 start_codon:yes stop_codon:yes gene_type:complete